MLSKGKSMGLRKAAELGRGWVQRSYSSVCDVFASTYSYCLANYCRFALFFFRLLPADLRERVFSFDFWADEKVLIFDYCCTLFRPSILICLRRLDVSLLAGDGFVAWQSKVFWSEWIIVLCSFDGECDRFATKPNFKYDELSTAAALYGTLALLCFPPYEKSSAFDDDKTLLSSFSFYPCAPVFNVCDSTVDESLYSPPSISLFR